MRRNDPLAELAALELLAGCSRHELERAASLLTPLTLPAGEVVVRQDSPGREFLIVADGELAVSRSSGTTTQQLGVARPGDVVGEMALLHRAPRTATVTTLTRSTVWAGSTREFFALLEAVPSAAAQIIAMAELREAANRAA